MGSRVKHLGLGSGLRPETTCSRCLSRLAQQPPSFTSLRRSSIFTKRRLHTAQQPNKPVLPRLFLHNYFLSNNVIDRGWIKNGAFAAVQSMLNLPSTDQQPVKRPSLPSKAGLEEKDGQDQIFDIGSVLPGTIPGVKDRTVQSTESVVIEDLDGIGDELPHRRRKRLKDITTVPGKAIPLDASAQLAKAAENMPASASFRRTVATYLSLSKPRLSFLIVLTSTAAYSLYPIPELLSSTTSLLSDTSLSTSTLTLAYLTTGTFLSSASANTLNMLSEPKYDALMSRTRNRPLVRNLVTPTAASMFALGTGTTGLTLLALGTNPTVAMLAAVNIFLYAGVYTPMKRYSVLNTWVGALVGGIPPLMGWAAAAGQAALSSGSDPSLLGWQDLLLTPEAMGGWLLAALLFAWQFPHFNALAHPIREEYKRAGFRMLAWTNPARNGRVALRYSLAMFPICLGLYGVGVVNEGFLVLSSACNLWMSRQAWVFWRKGGAGGSARGLFWASIWSLPLLMVGALVCKTGVWDGVFDRDEVEIEEEGFKSAQEARHTVLGVLEEPSKRSSKALPQ